MLFNAAVRRFIADLTAVSLVRWLSRRFLPYMTLFTSLSLKKSFELSIHVYSWSAKLVTICACAGVRPKVRENDVRMTTPDVEVFLCLKVFSLSEQKHAQKVLSPWRLSFVKKYPFSHLLVTGKEVCSYFESWDPKRQFDRSEQQLYVQIKM